MMETTSAEIGAAISTAQHRLQSMKAALGSIDKLIANAEARQRSGNERDAFLAAGELRTLAVQRVDAAELVAEAERRASEASEAYRAAVEAACRNLGKIERACLDAASRVDRALAEAAAALDDVDREADGLIRTLLPNGTRSATSSANVMAAVRKAFESRLSRGEQFQDKRSISDAVQQLMRTARENASLESKRKAAA